MSFSVIDTIKILDEYKQKVGSRLFYLNGPANLISSRQGLQFIESILSKTSGTEIKFEDYDEMILYGNSIDQLKKVISLPEIGASQGKCIKYISNLRKDFVIEEKISEMEKSALKGFNEGTLGTLKRQAQTMFNKNSTNIETIKYEFDNPKVVWTKASLRADYTHWLNKQSQIVIPGNYQYEASKTIGSFMPFVSSLDDKKQREVLIFLNNLKFADTLYKTDRDQNNKIIAAILARLDSKSDRYGENIFFSIVDIQPNEYLAISKMSFWNSDKTKIDSMFTIDKNMIGNGINKILNGSLEKQKMEQELKKQKEAEEAKKAKEKREKTDKENREQEYLKRQQPKDIAQDLFERLEKTYNLGNMLSELEGNTKVLKSENYSDMINRLGDESGNLDNPIEAAKSIINNT